MARKAETREGLGRDFLRVAGGGGQAGQHLVADPLHSRLIEGRVGQRIPQKGNAGVAVFGQEADADGYAIVVGIEGHPRSQRFGGFGKALTVQVCGPFLQQPHHEIGHAALVQRFFVRAAAEADIEGGERNRVFLDQPCGDAARRRHFLNFDRQRLERHQDGNKSANQANHCVASAGSGLVRYPVTE